MKNNRTSFQSDDALEKNLFFILATAQVCFIFLAVIVSVYEEVSVNQPFYIALMGLIPAATALYCDKKKNYRQGFIFLILAMNCFMFPTGYLLSGGLYSGMPSIMICGFVMCALCIDHTDRVATLVATVLSYGICFAVEFLYNDAVIQLKDEVRTLDMLYCFFCSGLTMFLILRIIMKRKEAEEAKRLQSLNERSEIYRDMLETQKENMESIKRVRHDVRHHDNMLLGMLQNGEMEKAIAYLNEKKSKDEYYEKKIYCMNMMINSILNYSQRQCDKNGITLRVDADVQDDIGIQPTDLVSAVANIMENAVHGAIASKDRTIRVHTFCKGHKFVFVCQNSYDGEFVIEDGIPKNKSTGIDNIIQTVNDYDGNINYSFTGNVVTCQIIMNRKDKVEAEK